MVEYDHPELSKDARKQIRSAVRKELAAHGIELKHRLRKIKPPGARKGQVGWEVSAYEAVSEKPTGERWYYVARSLNEVCKQALTEIITPSNLGR